MTSPLVTFWLPPSCAHNRVGNLGILTEFEASFAAHKANLNEKLYQKPNKQTNKRNTNHMAEQIPLPAFSYCLANPPFYDTNDYFVLAGSKGTEPPNYDAWMP